MAKDTDSYGSAFERAITAALGTAAMTLSQDEACHRGRTLQEKSPQHQTLLLENSSKYSRPEIVTDLVSQSFEARHANPQEMCRLALLALEVAATIPEEGIHRALAVDARTEAWTAVANAYRVKGDHAAAERAWAQAEELVTDGSGNPLLLADMSRQKAELRVDQRQYEEAKQLFTKAVHLYQQVGDVHLAGRTMIGLARAARGAGQLHDAIDHLFAAARKVNAQHEPSLQITITHNLAHYLDEAGFPLHALRILHERRLHPGDQQQRLLLLRTRWLEARITASLDLPAQAISILLSVVQGFLKENLPFDAALATLELAVFYAGQGKDAEARRLAEEIYPIFTGKAIPREASMAVLLYYKACTAESIALEMLQNLRKELQDHKNTHKNKHSS